MMASHRSTSRQVNVILTFDVECWPDQRQPLPATIDAEVAHHIYGVTGTGEAFGIDWQMDTMRRHGLRGVFFVEALSATRGFEDALRRVVRSIQAKGHDVEAHAHPEWFGYAPVRSLVAERCHPCIGEYSLEDQTVIVRAAVEQLRRCGASNLVAFRAGNFGANQDTLTAVRRAGLAIDSSYNAVYAGRECRIRLAPRTQPLCAADIWEYPVACFHDYPRVRPRHLRPLQVTASSFGEMSSVLLDAWDRRLHTMVVLSHSFEMTHFRPGAAPPRKHTVNVRRFERLCRFLGERHDLFRVVTFKEIVAAGSLPDHAVEDGVPESAAPRSLVRGFQNLSADFLQY
jgi:peptidoglycan/xylan/chitin deacetylase (PgdA/CDA1 family)